MCAVAMTNDCRYCAAIHHQFGLATGTTAEDLQAIGDGRLGRVDERDAVAIAFAVELVEASFVPSAAVRDDVALDMPTSLPDDVELIARFMTLANRSGNTLDALRARRTGVKDPTGSLRSELVVCPSPRQGRRSPGGARPPVIVRSSFQCVVWSLPTMTSNRTRIAPARAHHEPVIMGPTGPIRAQGAGESHRIAPEPAALRPVTSDPTPPMTSAFSMEACSTPPGSRGHGRIL